MPQRRERGTGRMVRYLLTPRHQTVGRVRTIPARFKRRAAGVPAAPAANDAPIPARQVAVDTASSRVVLAAVPVIEEEEEPVRLETQTGARAVPAPTASDALNSARQAVLATASSRVVLAAMEEEHDNSWYDSIILDAQKMEQMEEPGLGFHGLHCHQQQCPASEEEKPCYSPIMFDPDEAGPSTQSRPRVPPLADDEVPKFDCGICLETLPILDLFHGMQCGHRYCVECMATYIEGKINAGEVPIPCPDPTCREEEEEEDSNGGILHPEQCKKSIDFAAFSNWGYRLTESAIPPNRRAYCPNLRCGVMLEKTGGKTPAMAFCPACGHPMCATCGWYWSRDDRGQHDCTEEPNAALLKKLAEARLWKQCPRCKMLVEKIRGCDVMRCRCFFVFCYACGLPTGRQSGMEEGAELCRCHSFNHHV
ncbi:hypothetical protein BS78_02G192700 [Paspalum vaginatum]|nr:hypothetical protein BS78_02G192700 [Paspalum vaginatum]